MLEAIKLVNFGRISETGIALRKLSRVNYLVGENGSGKSSILEAIYANFQPSILPQLGINLSQSKFNFKLNSQTKSLKPEVLFLNQDSSILAKFLLSNPGVKDYEGFIKELLLQYNYLDLSIITELSGLGSDLNKTNDSSNLALFKSKFEKILEILTKFNHQKPQLILLEEPEHFLHPSLIKQLAYIFDEISLSHNVQFIIATHSPFLITSSGDITEKERIDCECDKKEFFPSQKVYLFKNGLNITKNGRTGKSEFGNFLGSDGYWGKKVGLVSAKMLGAGLADFISSSEPDYNEFAPFLILCEGQGKDEDARIYNTIFADKNPRTMFVSCRGNTQTSFSFEILEQVKNGIYGNFRIFMLRDRDHEFPTFEDIKEYRHKLPYRKVLFRRAIECYVFDAEIVKNFFEEKGLKLADSLLQRLQKLQAKIQSEAEHAVQGNSYKDRLIDIFEQILDSYNQQATTMMDFDEFKWQMVKQIKPNTKSYKQLVEDIFSD